MRVRFLILVFCVAACDVNDPTLMQVCEMDDGYSYPTGLAVVAPACTDPVEIVWDHIPLTVAVDPALSDYQDSFEEAVRFWRRELGFELFRFAVVGEAADVSVVSASVGGPEIASVTHDQVNGIPLTATIHIKRPGDITEMYYVTAHELGHVVGLAHDPQQFSIMHPEVDVGFLNEGPGGFPYAEVTANDCSALRKLYLK